MAEENQPTALPPCPAFSIWPPNEKTRDAVIERLVETLSNRSVLSERYGVMDAEEASSTARIIENQAFLAASDSPLPASAGDDPTGLGIETLQLYSKEISKLVLDAVKSRASPGEKPQAPAPADAAPVISSEDQSQTSSAVSESSDN